jgi:hypothetical protein
MDGAADAEDDPLTIAIVDPPAAAAGTLTPDGDGNYTFTPAKDSVAAASFTYTVSDGQATSVSRTVDIAIGERCGHARPAQRRRTRSDCGQARTPWCPQRRAAPRLGSPTRQAPHLTNRPTRPLPPPAVPVNDAPVLPAGALALNTSEDTALPITKAQLVAGVADVDSSSFTVTVLAPGPSSGTLSGPNASGDYTFRPAPNSNATVTFTYTVTNDDATAPQTSNARTVAITVGARARASLGVGVAGVGWMGGWIRAGRRPAWHSTRPRVCLTMIPHHPAHPMHAQPPPTMRPRCRRGPCR